MRFVKGHGTENDFLLLPDLDGELELTPRQVAALCDRRAGLGADGILRVVPTALAPEVSEQADDAQWFMDYRNADGSTAEMCGNGIRVFACYLHRAGLVPYDAALPVATRGGVRLVRPAGDGVSTGEGADPARGAYTVDMGPVRILDDPADLKVATGGSTWPATRVYLPNPHAVAFVDDLADAGDLPHAPEISPDGVFPDGANVEFVVQRAPAHLAMRVHERGVGETRSCGTGVVAVAAAAMRRDASAARTPYTVDVPGGRLGVLARADGHLELTGPAVLVAQGEVDDAWLTASA